MCKPEIRLHPRLTNSQKEAILSKSPFLLLTGVAGTGKTYCAIARGLQLIRDGSVDKIIIVRSAVAVRSIGFLPGDDAEKADPYAAPYVDLIKDISPKTPYKMLEAKKVVEFHLTSFLRGMTYDDAVIIVDEFQNMSEHELQTVATRVGNNTQLIVCGDSDQTDLHGAEAQGHKHVINVFRHMPEFHTVTFGVNDIVRSPFVKSYYKTKARLLVPPPVAKPWKAATFSGMDDAISSSLASQTVRCTPVVEEIEDEETWDADQSAI